MANQQQPVLSGRSHCRRYRDMMTAWIHVDETNQKLKRNRKLVSKEATMRMLRLIPILMLLASIGLPVVPAIACSGCCDCNMSCGPRSSCCCPGLNGCATCAAEDFETFQSSSAATEATSDIAVVGKPMASIATNSRMLDRLIRVGQTGQCAVNKFALRLLADGQKLLRFDEMFLRANVNQDNTVALRITEQY